MGSILTARLPAGSSEPVGRTGAAGSALHPYALLRGRLIRPRLGPVDFAAASTRGHALSLPAVLAEHGI